MLVDHKPAELAIEIKYRLAKANRTQRQLAKMFRKTESQISNAIQGNAEPRLLSKILSYLDKLENRESKQEVK